MALSNTADDVDADAALAQQQKCYCCCSCHCEQHVSTKGTASLGLAAIIFIGCPGTTAAAAIDQQH